MKRWWLAAVLGLALSGCGNDSPSAGSAAVPTAASTVSASPTAGSTIAGTYDVGEGRHLYLECSAGEGPTIVIDVGGEDTIDGSWGAVYEPMKSNGRVCAYDRANLGRSDPDPGPRTIKDVGDDLITLLHVAEVPGPYVFVGGSFGGNIVGVLAANHPEEVAGLVLVDADPANDDPALDPFRQNLPATTYQECCAPELYQPDFDADENVEHIDWKGGHAAELASVHSLPRVPTIVLTASRPDCEPSWPCAAIARDDARLQAEWIKANPRGSQKIIDSGHVMQREAPDAIVQAARTVVAAIRAT
jgi:pimeloyl-ACP methyl ester carboxylesterase